MSTDRYRHRSNMAALGVLAGLTLASIASWAMFALTFLAVL